MSVLHVQSDEWSIHLWQKRFLEFSIIIFVGYASSKKTSQLQTFQECGFSVIQYLIIEHKIYRTKYAYSFILLFYIINSYWFHMIHLPISFRVASVALRQSYDCPSATDSTLKDMDKSANIKTKQNTNKHQICVQSGEYYLFEYCY